MFDPLGTDLTVTLHSALTPFAVAVIVAVPFFFAVTFPFLSTLATELLEDLNDALSSLPVIVAFSTKLSLAYTDSLFLSSLIVGFTILIVVSCVDSFFEASIAFTVALYAPSFE